MKTEALSKSLFYGFALAALITPCFALSPQPLLTGYTSRERVAEHCPSPVVWVLNNLSSRVYDLPGSKNYGQPKNGGFYACKGAADRAGFAPATGARSN